MPYKLKSDRGPKQEDPDDASARFHQLVKSVDAPASGSCLKTLLVWALPSLVVPLILWLFLVTLRSLPLGIFKALGVCPMDGSHSCHEYLSNPRCGRKAEVAQFDFLHGDSVDIDALVLGHTALWRLCLFGRRIVLKNQERKIEESTHIVP